VRRHDLPARKPIPGTGVHFGASARAGSLMQVRTDTNLQLGDRVLIESSLDQVAFAFRGRLSKLLPKVVWVDVAEPGCPPLVRDLKEGHPVRLTAARDCHALVGESTFLSCLGLSRRLVALGRPADMQVVDRRSSLRVALRRPVGVRSAPNSGAGDVGDFVIGMSCEVSLAGMGFEAAFHGAVGDRVFITMVLEQNRPLHALAQIVRFDDVPGPSVDAELVRAAVKWDARCPADRQRLESFIVALRAAGQFVRG
jgi:hypothetical protein